MTGAREWAQILRIAADQLPSLSPVGELTFAAMDMLAGKKPVESWTGRPIVDERVFEARSTPEATAWPQFGAWAWQEVGLGAFYGIIPEWKQEEARAGGLAGKVQAIDQTPGLALLDDIVGRFLRVSDYGRYQIQQREVMALQDVERAPLAVVKVDLARRLAAGELLDDQPTTKPLCCRNTGTIFSSGYGNWERTRACRRTSGPSSMRPRTTSRPSGNGRRTTQDPSQTAPIMASQMANGARVTPVTSVTRLASNSPAKPNSARMIAYGGRLYLSLSDGSLLCLGAGE